MRRRAAPAVIDGARKRHVTFHQVAREGPAGKECETFLPAVKFGSEPVANYPKFDPQKCHDLLAQAGFPGGNGMPELQYSTSTGLWSKTKEYSELIVAQLQAQGIPCKLTVMETSAFLTSLFLKPDQEPAAHLIDHGFNTGSAEPNLFLRTMFYSKVSPVGGIFNGCKDPEIDAAIDAETNETDLEKRRTLVEAACSKIAEKVPSFSLYTSMPLRGQRANSRGFTSIRTGLSTRRRLHVVSLRFVPLLLELRIGQGGKGCLPSVRLRSPRPSGALSSAIEQAIKGARAIVPRDCGNVRRRLWNGRRKLVGTLWGRCRCNLGRSYPERR